MKPIHKSAKLSNVLYDVRGPIVDAAKQMEDEGQKIIKLNIGNLAPFGFDAPEEIQQDMIRNLPNSAGYSDSKGIFAARKAVMHYSQQQGVAGVTLDDIYLGNGASDLIVMATMALLDDGDELLVPAPTTRCGLPRPVLPAASRALPVRRGQWLDAEPGRHPRQDHAAHARIVVINPNNPPARCIRTNCCAASSRSRASMSWCCLPTRVTTRCCTTAFATRPWPACPPTCSR